MSGRMLRGPPGVAALKRSVAFGRGRSGHRIRRGADADVRCCYWAQMGECELRGNPYWMRPFCQRSCGTFDCSIPSAELCPVRIDVRGCPWDVPSRLRPPPNTTPSSSHEFPQPPLFTLLPPTQPPVTMPQRKTAPSEDKHPLCCYWASKGQCDANPLYMRVRCRHSCGTPGCTFRTARHCPVRLNTSSCVKPRKTHPRPRAQLRTSKTRMRTAAPPGPQMKAVEQKSSITLPFLSKPGSTFVL